KNRKLVEKEILSINALNFESLTYDHATEKFLVVSKDAVLNTSETKRIIYEIANGEFHNPAVYMEIDVLELNQVISSAFGDSKSESLLFNPSDIAVHPITKEVYVLSAQDRVLVVYNNKSLKSVFPLPAEV